MYASQHVSNDISYQNTYIRFVHFSNNENLIFIQTKILIKTILDKGIKFTAGERAVQTVQLFKSINIIKYNIIQVSNYIIIN